MRSAGLAPPALPPQHSGTLTPLLRRRLYSTDGVGGSGVGGCDDDGGGWGPAPLNTRGVKGRPPPPHTPPRWLLHARGGASVVAGRDDADGDGAASAAGDAVKADGAASSSAHRSRRGPSSRRTGARQPAAWSGDAQGAEPWRAGGGVGGRAAAGAAAPRSSTPPKGRRGEEEGAAWVAAALAAAMAATAGQAVGPCALPSSSCARLRGADGGTGGGGGMAVEFLVLVVVGAITVFFPEGGERPGGGFRAGGCFLFFVGPAKNGKEQTRRGGEASLKVAA
jgi:hypothetical protein